MIQFRPPSILRHRDSTLYWLLFCTITLNITYSIYGIGFSNGPSFSIYMVLIALHHLNEPSTRITTNRIFYWTIAFFLSAALSLQAQNKIYGSMIDVDSIDTFEFATNNLAITVMYFLFGATATLPTTSTGRVQSAIGLTILLLVLSPSGFALINYDNISLATGKDVNQLHVSLSVLVLVNLIYSYAKSYIKPICLIAGYIALFITGSRTGFFLGLAATLIVLIFTKRRHFVLWLSLAFAVSAAMIYLQAVVVDEGLARMLFSGGLEQDASRISRSRLLDEGLSALSNQILIGDMNFVVANNDHVASYMHNALSYWQQYGLVVFILFCYLIYLLLKSVYHDLKSLRLKHSCDMHFRVLVGLFCSLAIIASMSYTFKWIWFALGMYAAHTHCPTRMTGVTLAESTHGPRSRSRGA